jgi:PiT family inorganic phosphate transporter
LSPLIGCAAGLALMTPSSGFPGRRLRASIAGSAGEIVGGIFSLNHGANDARSDGHHRGVLFAAGYIQTFYIPFWVVLMAHGAISLGTWRGLAHHHTMGSRSEAQPVSGFAAESTPPSRCATNFGVPVARRTPSRSDRRCRGDAAVLGRSMGVAGQILWAWLLTIPAAFTIGAKRSRCCASRAQ